MIPLLKRSFAWFTIIEVLVAISIIATLSVVAYASTQAIQTSRYNTKRIADVSSLTNALEAQYLQTKVIPDPTANRQYFDNHGGYMHSASGAYGVTSLFSEDILSKSALAYHPRDPATDAYYAYGKLLQYSPEYQIGAVLRIDGTPTSYIRGTYSRSELDSLIRGYNTTLFATDGSTDALPYNPYKKEVTAYIVESSGAITISPTKTLIDPIEAGDNIDVGTWGLAVIKVSDGTELILGSETTSSSFSFNTLDNKDDTGLLTQVRWLLSAGEVVAKAPKLRTIDGNRSDLEIQTGNAVAAVRGTIFSVKAAPDTTSNSSFTLIVGSLQIEAAEPTNAITISGSGVENTTVTVPEWQPPVIIDVTSSSDNRQSAVSQKITDPENSKIASIVDRVDTSRAVASMLVTPNEIIFNPPTSSNQAWAETSDISRNGTVKFKNIPWTDIIRVNGRSFEVDKNANETSVGFDTSEKGEYEFNYCNTKFATAICSKPYKITIPNPKAGSIPLNSLAPIVEGKIASIDLRSNTIVDSWDIAMSSIDTEADNTISTTTTPTDAPMSTITPTTSSGLGVCSGLGSKEAGSDLMLAGCVDYTKGSHVLRIATGSVLAGSVSNKGPGVTFTSDGISLNRAANNYLNYLGNGKRLEGDFELELGGIKGSDLKRVDNNKYYLIESGTGGITTNLRIFVQNQLIHIGSDIHFRVNSFPYSIPQYSTWIVNVDANKKYRININIQDSEDVTFTLKESTSADPVQTVKLKAQRDEIWLQYLYIWSSKNNNLSPTNTVLGQWGAPIQYLKIRKNN